MSLTIGLDVRDEQMASVSSLEFVEQYRFVINSMTENITRLFVILIKNETIDVNVVRYWK